MTDSNNFVQKQITGTLNVTDQVITDLVGYAALESYGVVGMAAPSLPDGIAKLLPARALSRGVTVINGENGVSASLYVIIEQGMNLATVSKNLADSVRFVLEHYANLEVDDVQIHVQGIHTSAKQSAKQ
ncbi:hypothetical protein FACS1894104_2210 [Actinomycetota bacterium]|nr:hypothetical protein FACS1894104_2210 [Actinomycetota bacterium]